MSKWKLATLSLAAAVLLSACGERVQVPPAHVGKVLMTGVAYSGSGFLAEDMREKWRSWFRRACGPEARWFEPKTEIENGQT